MLAFFWILAALAGLRLLIGLARMLVFLNLFALAISLPAGLLVGAGVIGGVPAFVAVCGVWAVGLCAAGMAIRRVRRRDAPARRRAGHGRPVARLT